MPPATGAKVSRAGIEAIKRQRELMNVIENIDDELADEMAACYLDPYRFVLIAFDWGYGELEKFPGPDKWQTEHLCSIRDRLKEMRSR
jgi:hypothetical protein